MHEYLIDIVSLQCCGEGVGDQDMVKGKGKCGKGKCGKGKCGKG